MNLCVCACVCVIAEDFKEPADHLDTIVPLLFSSVWGVGTQNTKPIMIETSLCSFFLSLSLFSIPNL